MLLKIRQGPDTRPHKVDRILDSLDAQNQAILRKWLLDRDADGKFETSAETISYSLLDAGFEISPSWLAHWRRGHAS